MVLLAVVARDSIRRYPLMDNHGTLKPIPFLVRWQINSQSADNFAVSDFGRDLLLGMPNNSLLVISGDLHYASTVYHHYCEGLRPDVVVFSKDLSTYSWYRFTMEPYAYLVDESGTRYSVFPPHGISATHSDGLHPASVKHWKQLSTSLRPDDPAISHPETAYSYSSLVAWNNKRGNPVYFSPNYPSAPGFEEMWAVRPEGMALLAYPKPPSTSPTSAAAGKLRKMIGVLRFPDRVHPLFDPLRASDLRTFWLDVCERYPTLMDQDARNTTWPRRPFHPWGWEAAVERSKFIEILNMAFFLNKINRAAAPGPDLEVITGTETLCPPVSHNLTLT